jgi:hypothetical protein
MTDRDKLVIEIERMCVITGKTYEERDHTITVHNGPKFIFTAEGEVKSIIRDGKAYGPNGQRPYVAPKGNAS